MRANGGNRSRFRKHPPLKTTLFTLSLLSLFLLLFLFSSNNSNILSPPPPTKCPLTENNHNHKFLWYAPHSGFSNQLSEFKNALLISAILNRTLILPPVLDHHSVVLGSCPKFRVTDPDQLRVSVWNHIIHLIQSHRYVSVADIIDISSLGSSIRVMDLRSFVSMFCKIDLSYLCVNGSEMDDSLMGKIKECGSLLSGYDEDGGIKDCVYGVKDDCRTTVWTYRKDGGEKGWSLDSFQPDEELKKKKKISFVRWRKDVYTSLGPGSIADRATVLSFGSLFTAPYKGSESYIDIHEAPGDKKIQSLITKIEFLPFVDKILDAGKAYARDTVKSPFLCAQLRLLDGQFKNHRTATFQGLKQKLDSLKQKENLPVHVFVMTDLPMSNWSGTNLGDLANDTDSFKLFLLSENDDLVRRTAKKVVDSMQFGAFSNNEIEKDCRRCQMLPDILLHVEETVCSCASLGFVGTAGSTIADSIELMRTKQICSP